MANWSASMLQTFEFYKVDPVTWGDIEPLHEIISAEITRDGSSAILQNASFESTEDLGECYIRIYLKITQYGFEERIPLGTFLVQTPSSSFDGKNKTVKMEAYSPLLELKDSLPQLGYTIMQGDNIMDIVSSLCEGACRAPVIAAKSPVAMYRHYTADGTENLLDFINGVMSFAKFKFDLDEYSRVLFAPIVSMNALQPVYTFTDDNSSILLPDVTLERDLYGVPNAVEVIYSNGGRYLYKKIVNDNPNSPISTVNRGREIVFRDTNPSFSAVPTEEVITDYAENLLDSKSTIACSITYSHGYCPVRVGDAVRLNYEKAGLINVKAQVVSQTIQCETGCIVSETAAYTQNLWR